MLRTLFIALLLVGCFFEWAYLRYARAEYYLYSTLRRNVSYQEAFSRLKRAIELNPGAGLARMHYSKLLMDQKHYLDAWEQATRAHQSFHSINTYKQLGSIDLQNQNYSAARGNFVKVTILKPFDLQAMERLFMIDYQTGHFAEAATWLNKLDQVYPQNFNNAYFRGLLLVELRRPAEARQAFQKALSMRPVYGNEPLFNADQLKRRI
ncbi:MAG: hypothetical protein V2A74_01690 [bacterium]